MSAAPVEQILAALEGAGLVVHELDDGSVNMEGTREGEHGTLVVAVEIYELTPELVVVEVRRKSGGAAEYEEFFRAQLKPGLRDLVCDEPTTLLQSDERSRSL